MKKVTFVIAIAMLLALCATPVYAQVPLLPHSFYGSLEINGLTEGTAGTHVKATGDGVEVPMDFNPIITGEDGQYGGPAWDDPKLIVQGDIADGGVVTIEFHVSRDGTTWFKANETAKWYSGKIEELPLSATIPEEEPPAPAGGGAPTYYIETDLFGVEKSYRIDWDGEIRQTITSGDVNLTITIPKGTTALDKDSKRLKTLVVAVDESPPDPPEDDRIIGLAYDFSPDGATFEPPMTLTWTYGTLPEGVAEEDLVIAYYDGIWVGLDDFEVDTGNNTITASVPHLTTFAIIGVMPPPPPPPPPVPPPPPPVAPPVTPPVAPPEVPPEVTITVPPEVTPPVVPVTPPVTVAPPEVVPAPVPIAPAPVAPPVLPPEAVTPEVPTEEEEGVNWPLVGGIIGAVVVALLLFFYIRIWRHGRE